MSNTARRYRAALSRLVAGKGRHPVHAGKAVRITPAAVAREAGMSRNPLYATHRDILDEIEVAAGAPAPAKDLASELAKRTAELRDLRDAARRHEEQKRALVTENLALLYRARTAEDTIKARDRIIARLEMLLRQQR